MLKDYKAEVFIGRAPLLPFSAFEQYLSSFTTDKLKSLYNQQAIQEALFISSPILFDRLKKAASDNTIWDDQRFIESLTKYALRALSRCTPYGLFAGLFTGKISNGPSEIKLSSTPQPNLRLDMGYLVNVYNDLLKDQDLKSKFKYYSNNSLYRVTDKWRYTESRFSDQRTIHDLVHIDNNPVLSKIIKVAKGGIDIPSCIRMIVKLGYSDGEAKAYTEELIQAQVLVSEIHPIVSGEPYQDFLFKKLKSISNFCTLNDEITNIIENTNSTIETTRKLKELLSKKFTTPIDDGKFVQVDSLIRTKKANLNNQIVENIKEAASILNFVVRDNEVSSTFSKFKKAVSERYEEAEIPLVQLLDTDIGINYRQAYKEIEMNNYSPNNIVWDHISKYKFNQYSQAIKEGKQEVIISNNDFDSFPKENITFSDSMIFMGELIHRADEYLISWGYLGHNPTSLLGRFGYISTDINNICNEIARVEEVNSPHKIFAEIVHISEGRLGNVITRPSFREYEIPYLAHSNLPESQQIPVNDLMVSIRNNKLILRSKRLNKEVIPRMSNAHNYSASGLPIYHLLCDIQKQGIRPYLNWSWEFLEEAEFLPRVRYKNVILRPAIWNIPAKNLQNLAKIKGTERYNKFKELKEFNQLPRRVILTSGDNGLFLDLSETICIDLLIRASQNIHTIRFTEFLFENDSLIFADENDRGYVNEIIIPFINHNSNLAITENSQKLVPVQKKEDLFIKKSTIPRVFHPFDNWIYYKFYTGSKSSDFLLMGPIFRIINKLKKEKLIQKWFFVRYTDPKYHLRIRFLLSSNADLNRINIEISKALTGVYHDSIIWKVQTETYRREIERYGPHLIEVSETFFHINSECVQEILRLFKTDFPNHQRFLAGILGVHRLIEAFGLSPKEQEVFIGKLASEFSNEFNVSNILSLREQIIDEFRLIRPKLDGYLLDKEPSSHSSTFLALIDKALLKQSQRISEKGKGLLNKTIPKEVLSSYCHMYLNRLFNLNQRFQEMLVYNILVKYYKSLTAQRKYNPFG